MDRANRVQFANTLRGLAALCVVMEHYFHVFWTSGSIISGLTHTPDLPAAKSGIPIYVGWLNSIPFFGWGPFGVALFFLISGFVIPFSLTKTNAYSFILHRAIRIYPVYFAGFCVTLIGIYIGGVFFERPWPLDAATILKHVPGIRDLLWSPTIDGIIWTLEIEVKFYVICAVAAPLFRKRSTGLFAIPILIFVPAFFINKHLSWLLAHHLELYKQAANFIGAAQYLIFMFIGVSFHFAFRRWIVAERAMLLSSALFAGFVILAYTGPYPTLLPIVWSYGFAVIVFLFAYSYPSWFAGNRVTDFFASISYPLYVLHGIAGYVALRILVGSGFRASVSLMIVTLAALLLAWIIHVAVERPSQRLIDRLKRANGDRVGRGTGNVATTLDHGIAR